MCYTGSEGLRASDDLTEQLNHFCWAQPCRLRLSFEHLTTGGVRRGVPQRSGGVAAGRHRALTGRGCEWLKTVDYGKGRGLNDGIFLKIQLSPVAQFPLEIDKRMTHDLRLYYYYYYCYY